MSSSGLVIPLPRDDDERRRSRTLQALTKPPGYMREEEPMFIGFGTIVVIVIIVLAVMFLRRH